MLAGVLLALTLAGPGFVTGARHKDDVDIALHVQANETEVDFEDSESEAPPCCSNRGCCQHARKNPKRKVKKCLQGGFATDPDCQRAAQRFGLGGMPMNPGMSPGMHPGMHPGMGPGMPHMPGMGGHKLEENEVCCMCAKAKSPKTWFPVPPSMWDMNPGDHNDADFRSMNKCKSKCASLCAQSQMDFMNPSQAAGLTLGIGLSMDPSASPQLKQLALTVFPRQGGCFTENYLGQVRSAGINVIARPDDMGNPWTGSFNNIC